MKISMIGIHTLPKALFTYRTAIHETSNFSPFHLTFVRSPQLPIDLILGRLQSSKVSSYPQFVQEAHRLLKASCTRAREYLRAQHLRQQQAHDNHSVAETFHVGDRVWLYTPVVSPGRTRKFSSLWKRSYTILDKSGAVNYKV